LCALNNLGNTCWGNSLLQVLAKIQSVRTWLRQHERIASEANEAHARPCCLCDLAADLRRLSTSVVNVPFDPQCVVNRVQWNRNYAGMLQQDAQEAYTLLLAKCNEVDEEVLKCLDLDDYRTAKYSTPFCHIFGGLSSEAKYCLACSHSRQVLQGFYRLGLKIPDEEHPSVESALRLQSGVEHIGATARCDECGVLGRRAQSSSVLRWPVVLTLAINRSTLDGQKITRAISFQLTLSVPDGSIYDLRGVVVHQGDTVRAGHYRAFVCARDKTWFHCNDARKPRVVTEAEVLSAEAYILCYEKR
jgi:ubiquitin C-terminal hydrolase